MADVFGLLARVSAAEGQGRLPGWLATHPDPGERSRRVSAQAAAAAPGAPGDGGRGRYLAQLDGLVYGPDPREGFFREGVFHHPALRFRISSPAGWKGVNQKQAVVWQAPQKDALFALTLSPDSDPRLAAQRFFAQQGVAAIGNLPAGPRGFEAEGAEFQAQTQQGAVQGAVSFVAHGDNVYQLLGFAPAAAWRRHADEVARALASFQPERDREVLAAEPMRIDLKRVPNEMTLAELDRRFPSTAPLHRIALLNNMEASSRLRAGQEVKRVVGGPAGGMDQ
jgi:predicted Zn-dependent protease